MHQPVLLKEAISLLNVRSNGIYIDATFGNGGHAEAILEKLNEKGILLAIDCDEDAVRRGKIKLKKYEGKIKIVHGRYSEMEKIANTLGIQNADGIIIDAGVSSDQLDDDERGFSFIRSGPLDMRMDRTRPFCAADIVNKAPEKEIARILFEFGEEKKATRIAAFIVEERKKQPIKDTSRLAEIVERVTGKQGKIHAATRTFQALRIAVNNELEELQKGIDRALRLLAPRGRIVVITFHSLEDRIVKNIFLQHAVKHESLPCGGWKERYEEPPIKIITKHVLTPSDEEQRQNPRCRSAKLRAAERI